MRIAFYAPMKPPTAARPSGDRRMARCLITAFRHAGHDVELASRFRSWDGAGDTGRQRRLRATGERLADRLIARYRSHSAGAPELWFTYHVYYKAPDWIGPSVSRALDIPYVVAEASHAPKRAGGPWAIGHDGAEAAIRAADGVVGFNGVDTPCLLPLLNENARLVPLKPFLDTGSFTAARRDRTGLRRALAASDGIAPDIPLLVSVAMMRPGDKLASYRVLAEALGRIGERPWQLAIVGEGEARADVERAMAPLGADRTRFLGALSTRQVPRLLAAADLLVWPAINEAYGMAILEAQAAGVPVVAGRTGGVPDIVRDGVTGLLTPVDDADAFAMSVAALLDDPERRQRMGAAAERFVADEHSLDVAAERLAGLVAAVRRRRAA